MHDSCLGSPTYAASYVLHRAKQLPSFVHGMNNVTIANIFKKDKAEL